MPNAVKWDTILKMARWVHLQKEKGPDYLKKCNCYKAIIIVFFDNNFKIPTTKTMKNHNLRHNRLFYENGTSLKLFTDYNL